MFQGGLFGGLLAEKVFGLSDTHSGIADLLHRKKPEQPLTVGLISLAIIDVSGAQTLGANFGDGLPFYDVKPFVLMVLRMT